MSNKYCIYQIDLNVCQSDIHDGAIAVIEVPSYSWFAFCSLVGQLRSENIKWKIPAKIGTTKDRNGIDITKADDIMKRWQEYIEELYKKDLHDPDICDGVVTPLEPDIMEF